MRVARRVIALIGLAPCYLAAQESIIVGSFSTLEPDKALDGWVSLQFEKIPRHTLYRLETTDHQVALCAESKASASGLIKPVSFSLADYPYVAWRWKVENLYEKSDVTRKAGDDYPARLYITFKTLPDQLGWIDKIQFEAAKLVYGEYPPVAALNYIWATREPEGLVVDNAYTSRAKMFVVESGALHLGEWRSYSRNVLEDFRRAFGHEPLPLAGVAVMTDSDNTGESARACYGDIVFSKTPPEAEQTWGQN